MKKPAESKPTDHARLTRMVRRGVTDHGLHLATWTIVATIAGVLLVSGIAHYVS